MIKPRPVFVLLATYFVQEWVITAVPTFSGDNIIEIIVARELLLNKSTDDVLIPMRENESGECIPTPAYWANVLNVKLGWEINIHISAQIAVPFELEPYPRIWMSGSSLEQSECRASVAWDSKFWLARD